MSKMISRALVLLTLVLLAAFTAASAPTSPLPNVDLRAWSAEVEGGWEVAALGRSARGVGRADPQVLLSPEDRIGFVLRGRLRVESIGTGGVVGFVLGRTRIEGSDDSLERLVLLEWGATAAPGETSGARLRQVTGSAPDTGALLADSSAHVQTLGVQTGRGLFAGRTHEVEIEYRVRRVRVSVEGRQLLDASGDFAPGRLGLYVVGDAEARFSDLRLQVGNALPVADAGEAMDVTLGGDCPYTLQLDGSRSSDPDGDTLSYRWAGDFGVAEGPRPELSPSEGRHRLTLVVDDGRGAQASDSVSVRVREDALRDGRCSASASQLSLAPSATRVAEAKPTPAREAPGGVVQGVAVAGGSYTTTLPSGKIGPSSCDTWKFGAGDYDYTCAFYPAIPKVVSGFSQPVQTNDWWSSLVWGWPKGTDAVAQEPSAPQAPFSEAIFPHPWGVKTFADGLGMSYQTFVALNNEYHYHYQPEDLRVGAVGLNASGTVVARYSDWAVTSRWTSGSTTLEATMGRGFPFVYFTVSGANARVNVTTGFEGAWYNSGGVLGLKANGHFYAVFAPAGSTWTGSNPFESTLGGKGYFSVAVLPDNSTATLEFYRARAYAFVTDTRVSWSFNQASSRLSTTYTVTTTLRENPSGTNLNEPLIALYRSHWINSTDALTSYSYVSPRGQMKVRAGSSFTTSVPFLGVLPALPDKGSYDRTTLYNYVNDVYLNGPYIDSADTYWGGKDVGRLSQLVWIADQMGHTAARDAFLNELRTKLQDWLSSDDGGEKLFYYDATWDTLIGYPESYDTNTQLNDHHFHWAYLIQGAVTVTSFDPAWANTWGGMVNLLIKDAANWDRADTMFPFLRYYEPYSGHSRASGHGYFGSGNNEESSSEGMNFATSLILWGSLTQNTSVRDLGIFLYANTTQAIQQYWFDVDDAVFPSGFNYDTVGMVWDNGAAYATWWTANPEEIHGINFVPITGGSLYLGQRPEYVTKNYNFLVTQNGGVENEWRDLIWEFQAFADPAATVSKFGSGNYTPEDGESKAHTYHWIHNLNAMGRVDTTVTADAPTAAVFNKSGVRTYAAFNPGSSTLNVRFSTGLCLSVPARKIVAGPGSTTCGTNQAPSVAFTAPTSGASVPAGSVAVSVSASDTDGTVAGVQLYVDGTSAGTDTTAPYSWTVSLAAGAHTLRAVATDNGGATGESSIPVTAVAGCTGTGTGLKGEYFDAMNLTSLFTTRTDANVNFDWGEAAPVSGMGVDSFSVRWTGQVQACYTQTYTFYTNSDDGIRLWVNGQQVINNWTDHGPTENSGTIALSAGQKYAVTLEFYENGGGALASLSWSSTSQAKQIVPQTLLSPPVVNQPPSVAFTAPTSGASVPAGSVAVAVSASDSDGTVSGVQLYVDGTSAGTDTTSPYSWTVTLAAGAHTLRAVATDNGGATGESSIPVTAVTGCTGTGTGLKGEYFDAMNLTSLFTTRTDATVNFDWGETAPVSGMGVDSFSVRWTGQVQACYTQTYTFYTNSDDGIRLWVNGQQVINNWTDHGPTENSGTIALSAGQKYAVTLEFYENGGGALASLSWSSTSQAKQIVPQTLLSPPVVNQPPSVAFTAPTSGASVPAGSVAVSVSASDTDGTVSSVQLYVDGTSAGTDTTSPYSWTVTLAAGAHTLRAVATDNGGATGESSIPVTAVAGCTGTGTGLKGEYFDAMNLTSLFTTRTDATVNFDWGEAAPVSGMGVDSFSARWTGQVQACYTQTYTFYTNSDDGIRLWVNGQQVINNWTDHGPTENSGTIALSAGQKYAVTLEFYENGGGALASLSWSSTSQAKQIVPQTLLSPPVSGDYGQGVTRLSSTQAQIWFQPTTMSQWVDVHYTVNGGAQSNYRMTYNSGAARWEQAVSGLATGSVIGYSFTYEKSGVAYDSPAFSYTH